MGEQSLFNDKTNNSSLHGYNSINKDTLDLNTKTEQSDLAVYKRRWYILTVFCALACMNGTIWNTWGPIAVSAEPALGWTNGNIAIISICACISGMIATPFCSWVLEVKGIRWAALLSASTLALGTGIRCITLDQPAFTVLAYLCATIDGLGATIVMSGGPCLSAVWFPANERVLATALATIATYLGNSAGFLLGPLIMHDIWPPGYFGPIRVQGAATFVYENGTLVNSTDILIPLHELRTHLRTLIWLEAGIASGLFLIVLIYYPAKPPKPPSISASEERTPFFSGIAVAVRQGSLWFLAIPFATAAAIYYSWTSVLDINLKPLGVSQQESGMFGFYGTLVGCVTGTLASLFMDLVARKERWTLIGVFTLCTGSSLWFSVICMNWIPFSTPELYISSILIGATLCGSVPLFFEMGCETVYPIPESVVSGLMTMWNSTGVIIFFLVFYIPDIGTMWMNWCLLALCAISIPLLIIFPEKYARLEIDRQEIAESSEVHSNGSIIANGKENKKP